MKFRYHKAGENIMNYKELGFEFFIMLQGTAALVVPKKK